MGARAEGGGAAWHAIARVLLVLAAVLAGAHGVRLVTLARTADAFALLALLAGLVCGALLADAMTGLVHWACDSWGSPRTRWLGPTLIRSFRDHHRDPLGMLAHDWVTVNAESGSAACAGLVLLSLPKLHGALAASPFLYALLLALLVLGGAANQLHQWAHAPRPPGPVAALQRGGLLLSRRRHARHHGPPHAVAYCISTGWLNPLLDGIGFWRGLERAVEAASGVPARRDDAPPQGPVGLPVPRGADGAGSPGRPM